MREINRLYIDVDNTTYNSTKRFMEFYNEKYNAKVNWEEIVNWDFAPHCELYDGEAREIFAIENFYSDIEYIDNSKRYIDELSEKFDICFVTMGTPENLRNKGKKLLEDFPYAGIIGLTKVYDKGVLDFEHSILIDDNPHLCSKHVWIYEYGIDKNWTKESLHPKFRSWKEISEKLLSDYDETR